MNLGCDLGQADVVVALMLWRTGFAVKLPFDVAEELDWHTSMELARLPFVLTLHSEHVIQVSRSL